MKREDDFQTRRKHLADLTEEQLEERFWKLAEEIVDPLVDLAYKNTSPSIERSVLMRMGFSSIECSAIVDGAIERGLLGKGAGHLVYRLAKEKDMPIREAGLKLAEGEMWEDVVAIFKGGAN
ncbi:ornithine aminomutase subunit alpha [Anaerosalibacter bizertensis]|uniref:Ornithine aminomutase subunit alpha n=1 Tax=Anaerosalibacter bizertensis TaxID=932217 RepID=A0A9Q4FM84_9FIRM|nr:ornithine aminomutase subunit alpha [Anaerosalibacter bizertensis]MBV1821571.1 ornithine aminomutase subunit alpha [Bacteroidales bacterium MSK.15.36]MCB5559622.1 ornithine aminomutase subunit alpha [Anaerosalibacter bizertensis]MCG4565658.1 ornithine aminomutase subunit alpha [Anaerosalibacter bizertensis]